MLITQVLGVCTKGMFLAVLLSLIVKQPGSVWALDLRSPNKSCLTFMSHFGFIFSEPGLLLCHTEKEKHSSIGILVYYLDSPHAGHTMYSGHISKLNALIENVLLLRCSHHY